MKCFFAGMQIQAALTNSHRGYGYALKGARLNQVRRFSRRYKLNILSCINWQRGLVAFRVLQQNVNGEDFENWIVQVLLPTIPPGGTIILDNASIHHTTLLEVFIVSQTHLTICRLQSKLQDARYCSCLHIPLLSIPLS